MAKCWRGALLSLRRAEAELTEATAPRAKQRQPMESRTPGSARKVQKSDERWLPLTNAQNLSYTLKVNEFTTIEVGYRVWSGLKHLGTEYLDQPLVDATKGAVAPVKNQVQCGNTSTYFVTKTIAGADRWVPREAQRVWQRIRLTVGSL